MIEKIKEKLNKYDLNINNKFILESLKDGLELYFIYFLLGFLFYFISVFIFQKEVKAETLTNTIDITNVSMNYNYYDKSDKKTHQVNNVELDSRYELKGYYSPNNLNYKLGTFDSYIYGRNFDFNFNIDFKNDSWNTITGSFLLKQEYLNNFEYYYKWFTFANGVNGEKNKFFKCAYKLNESDTYKIDFTCINAKSGSISIGWTTYGTDMNDFLNTISNSKNKYSNIGLYFPLNQSEQSDVDLEGYGLDGYIEGPTDPKDPNKTNTFLDKFPSIIDKEDNFILQLFTIPYDLISKVVKSFNGSCKIYNFGSIKGKEISMPCIDIKSIIGNTLYNIIDIIFASIIGINMIQRMSVIFSNLITLEPKFEEKTKIKIFR